MLPAYCLQAPSLRSTDDDADAAADGFGDDDDQMISQKSSKERVTRRKNRKAPQIDKREKKRRKKIWTTIQMLFSNLLFLFFQMQYIDTFGNIQSFIFANIFSPNVHQTKGSYERKRVSDGMLNGIFALV